MRIMSSNARVTRVRSEQLVQVATSDRMVIERLSEMAGQCECLAAWDDDRTCICGDTRIEVPLSISAAKKAAQIIGEIERVDHRISQAKAIPAETVDCFYYPDHSTSHEGMIWQSGDGRVHRETSGFALPKAVIIAALQTQRTDLIRQLQETGIVSIDLHNIKVKPI